MKIFNFIPNQKYSTIIYQPRIKSFITEASDLGLETVEYEFCLKNSKTGNIIKFKHFQTIRDREGDIIKWEFISVEGSKFSVKFIIYND